MLAPGNESDFMSCRSQLRAEIAAHGTGADDRDTHFSPVSAGLYARVQVMSI
jgi:hypothetical protein